MRKPLTLVLAAALFAAAGALNAEPRTVTLEVSNMTCALCPIAVKKAITRVPGVLDAKVDYDTKTAAVRFETEKTTIDAITAATANAGYPSRPLR
ncbi:MAG: heavy-metal-associated domain-containing protein [Burkholderiales bacterium]